MSDLTIQLHERRLQLKTPFGTSNWKLDERKIIILAVFDRKSGFTGYGESAPLEQFGTESYKDALRELREFVETADFAKALKLGPGEVPGFTGGLEHVPTARFAAESAVLDLRAQLEDVPLRVYLGGNEEDEELRVNAVVGDKDAKETETAVKRAAEDEYRCIKLKAGAREIDEDVDRVAIAREAAGDALLRIDVNGAWSRKDAERAIAKLEPLNIEYIEQPLDRKDRDGMAGLAGESPVPIAADESLLGLGDVEDLAEAGLPVFIFKPMVLGGLAEPRKTAEALHKQGKKVIVTSFIDSAVGRGAAMQFAGSLPFLQEEYHGLNTGWLFERDLAEMPRPEKGRIRIPPGGGAGVTLRLDLNNSGG